MATAERGVSHAAVQSSILPRGATLQGEWPEGRGRPAGQGSPGQMRRTQSGSFEVSMGGCVVAWEGVWSLEGHVAIEK